MPTNYRLYPTIDNYKRAPPPTTPWTELILEGLNLDPRKTRSIVLTIIAIAALVLVSAATIGGVYIAAELERQKCREELYAGISALTIDGVTHLSSTQEELNRITQEVVNSLGSEARTWYTSDHVKILITAIDRRMEVITSAFQCAMDQKISVLSFTELHFTRTAMKVERDARQSGLIPVSKHFSDYLQYPASFIQSKTAFTVMVHLPLIDPDSAMTLYMHHTLPIPLRDHLYLHLGPLDYTHLAISADGKFFRTMTLAQFNTCRTIREFHLCDRGLVVRKSPDKDAIPPVHKDPELCIFALFQRHFALAIAVCKTIIGVQTTAMQMVGPNIFASYAADPHQGTITCKGDANPSGPTTTTFTVDSAQQITLPFGCVAETDTHVIAAANNSFSRDVHEYSVAYTWPFDVHDLAHGLDTKALRGIMDRLGDLNNRTHHNMPLEKALAAVKEVNSNQHYLVSILALIIVCLAVVVGLLFVYGKRFRHDLQSDLRQGKQAIRQLEEDVAHLRQLALTGPVQQVQRYEPRVRQQAPLFPPKAPTQVIPRPDPEPIVPESHVHIHVGAGHQPSAVRYSARIPEEMALLTPVSEPLPSLH
jgi:hypothetical protein